MKYIELKRLGLLKNYKRICKLFPNEKPPYCVGLIGNRKLTQKEIDHGKTL